MTLVEWADKIGLAIAEQQEDGLSVDLNPVVKLIREAQREAYERAAEIVIDSPSYFTTKDRLGLAEAIRKEADK